MCGGQQRARGPLSQRQEQRVVLVCDGLALRLPVDLGGVAEIRVDGLHVVEVFEGVGGRFAEGVRHARVDVVGASDVASAEAEGADTALAILCEVLALRGDQFWKERTAAARCVGGALVAGAAECIGGKDGGEGGRCNGSCEGASEHG